MQHKNDSAAYWLKLRASMDTLNIQWQIETGLFIADFLSNYNESLAFHQTALNAALLLYGDKNESDEMAKITSRTTIATIALEYDCRKKRFQKDIFLACGEFGSFFLI